MKANILSLFLYIIKFKQTAYYRLIDDLMAVKIIKKVGKYFNLPRKYYNKDSRKDEFVAGRYIAMYYCTKNTGLTYEQIGRYFNRSHSTVTHAINYISDRRETDKKFDNRFTLFGIVYRLKH